MNVETLSNDYDEGEKSLSKAMRALVEDAYVVKFKIQRATTETVIEDGKEVVKRGGSWYTTFTVDSIPFTAADVASMVEEIYAEGNVKSHRVEPTRLDPKKASSVPSGRPTPPPGGVGPTRGNVDQEGSEDSDSRARPTPPRGALGRPTPGEGGAHIRKKTSSARAADEQPEDEDDALSGRSPGDARRASDRSKRARGEGGCAASGKTSPSPTPNDNSCGPASGQKSGSKEAEHSPKQLAVVRAVRAFFPPEFLKTLSDVPSLSSAILAGMAEGRTVEQMGDRIMYRWVNHGWAEKFHAGELNPKRLVGPAVDMVRPLRRGDRFACPDLRCETGASLDTGAPCRLCAERIADWKAEQARKYGPKSSGGANSGSEGMDSPGAPVPPQRAVQPSSEPCSTENWAAQARAEEEAREKGECDGRDGMCGNLLARGQSLCWRCAEDVAEQYYLENAGAPPPF
ncbi:hypothetical protein [Streptomyces sp. NBC_01435]|uniref:hypothetical protein n=1 Tax=Streptomyces sp. NBC_01435 TaxID=2903865 RepID=UPI002E2FFB16|nr:hypothetical protein [Streptomyces sp. NBC_01435]